MAQFTTRVELHKATSDDYDTLHGAMVKKGFSRKIESNSNVFYHLPTAEYNFEGAQTRALVLELAKTAASVTGKRHSILVTEAAGRTWYNLPKV